MPPGKYNEYFSVYWLTISLTSSEPSFFTPSSSTFTMPAWNSFNAGFSAGFAASAAVPTVFMAKNNTNGLINLFMMSPIC